MGCKSTAFALSKHRFHRVKAPFLLTKSGALAMRLDNLR